MTKPNPRTPPTPEAKAPLLASGSAPAHSQTLSPNDHVKAIIDLLRQGSPELARRWLAALLIVPDNERESVVSAIEQRVSELYPLHAPENSTIDADEARAGISGQRDPRQVRVVSPPAQRAGFVEQIIRTYDVIEPKGESAPPTSAERAKATKKKRA